MAWNITYSGGITKMPINDAASMPPNTGVLTLRNASFDAPDAMTSGTKPRINANDVIITGRNRSRAPSIAASSNGTPCSRRSFANSTIRDAVFRGQSDQHNHADLRVEIEDQTGEHDSKKSAGDADRYRQKTGTGMVQLS